MNSRLYGVALGLSVLSMLSTINEKVAASPSAPAASPSPACEWRHESRHGSEETVLYCRQSDGSMKYEVTPSDLNEQTLASAVSGNAQAMVVLGKFFAEGAKPARDLQAARRWFEQAGQLGSRAGMFDTGLAYERGDGGPPDRSGAQHWYRTAAELGDVSAALNLIALRLAEPPSLAGDTQTLSLIGKAVEGGSSAAMLDMGYIAENGRGIAPNESEAFSWYGR